MVSQVNNSSHSESKNKMEPSKTNAANLFKFFVFSLIGMAVFFVPFEWNGKSSIFLDHVVTAITNASPTFVKYYAFVLLISGTVLPFLNMTWNKGAVNIVFSVFRVVGLVVGIMIVFNIGPAWLFDPSMGPYLWDKLIRPVSLLVPIGSVFLALLVSYGLLEFVGVLMQRIMRPVFKTPGRSAIDAVASFVGSYSLGLLVTNRIYNEGKYSKKEAAIIATGFSTVSVTFMVVIAKTLNLMDHWLLLFWTAFVVTIVATLVTIRLRPLKSMSDDYADGVTPKPEEVITSNRLQHAWKEAMDTADAAPTFFVNVLDNLKDGLRMVMSILPTILSIGLLGLVLAEYTPVFDWIGYIFLPFTYILQAPEPLLTAKAAAVSISEVFLPALLVSGVEVDIATRFIVAVVSVSAVLFFSAMIPCILATDIPIRIRDLIIIWFERIVISLIIVIPFALLIF